MSYRFEIEAGASKKLLVGGKYCEEDIIVTALGGSDAPDVPDEPVTPEYSEGLEIVNSTVYGIGTCTDDIIVIPEEHQGLPVTTLYGPYSGSFKQIIMPDSMEYIEHGICECPNLERVEFGSGLESINYWCFNNNPKCKEYDFTRCTHVPMLHFYFDEMTEGYSFEGMPSDCKMIVPDALLDEWSQATNWTLYADYIVAEGQENAQEKTIEITENGSYEVIPDEGKLLRKVTVNVDTPDKKPEQEKTLNVTKDGTYTVTPDSGYVLKKVSVLVDTPDQKPEQNKSINVTENGSYSLTPDTGFVLNGATVNVAIPLKAEQEKTVDITNSGSFEILPDEGKLLSKVTVNASSGEDNIYSEGLEMEWDMAGYYIVNGRGDCTDKVIRIPDAYSDGTHGRARVAIFKNSALNSDELLTAVHIPTTMNTVSNGVLYGCPNLKKIYMPSIKMLENYSFRGSSSLEYVEFGWEIGSLGQNVFANCKSGAVFDFSKCYAVPTLDLGGWGYEFGSNPVIKVPNHLLSRWKIATNWTQYASYIVAAE